MMVTMHINPRNVKDITVSEVFEEVNFIPLETTKESKIKNIDVLRITKNNLVVYDLAQSSFLIFDKKGKFINKITEERIKKDWAGKLRNFTGFGYSIEGEDGAEVINIWTNAFIVVYDANGNFLRRLDRKKFDEDRKKIPKVSEYDYKRNWVDEDSTRYDFVLFKNDKVFSKYFPSLPVNGKYSTHYPGPGKSQSDLSKNYFMTKPYSYEIYKVSPPKVSLAYKMIFPEAMSMPEDFIDNPKHYVAIKGVRYVDRKYIQGISNIRLFGDQLFFRIESYIRPLLQTNAMVYNHKTGEVSSINKIIPDEKSFHLPITDDYHDYEFLNFGFREADDDYLYTICSSSVMFSYIQDYIDKNTVHNDVITNYYKDQMPDSNPVIIQLKPRK